jgi:hypothetical protein
MQSNVLQKALAKAWHGPMGRKLTGVWQTGLSAVRRVWLKTGHRGRVLIVVAAVALTAAALVGTLGSSWNKTQTAQISDVTSPTTLTLTADPRLKDVDRLFLRIRGNIDGTAQIAGAPLRARRVSGKFEIAHDGDHPATNCVISYMPVGVSKGQVTVDYEFRPRQLATY